MKSTYKNPDIHEDYCRCSKCQKTLNSFFVFVKKKKGKK